MKSPKTKRAKKVAVTYTHRDASGMVWRFAGGRPVSRLADEVMHAVGLPLWK